MKKKTVAKNDILRERGEDFKRIYANHASLAFTPMDVHITFGESLGDVKDEPTIHERAVIVMSPQMAKALSSILVNNLKAYEAAHGEVCDRS